MVFIAVGIRVCRFKVAVVENVSDGGWATLSRRILLLFIAKYGLSMLKAMIPLR